MQVAKVNEQNKIIKQNKTKDSLVKKKMKIMLVDDVK